MSQNQHPHVPFQASADCDILQFLFAKYDTEWAALILRDTDAPVFVAIDRCFEASIDAFLQAPNNEQREILLDKMEPLHNPAFMVRFLATAAAKQARQPA